MNFFKYLISAGLLLGLMASHPLAAAPSADTTPAFSYRGWDYLAERLIADGVGLAAVQALYADPRMPEREWVFFSLEPREDPAIYRHFSDPKLLPEARHYLKEHEATFQEAEERFDVERQVIAAIILVETRLGRNLGRHLVANRLSRLAGIAEPENIRRNFQRMQKTRKPAPSFEQVQARAQYLEEMFYPELRALFQVAALKQIDVLDLKGSAAGAFGIPQFLPTSYLNFALDGNNNGTISLFEAEDAIISVANYLAGFGWQRAAATAEKRKILWQYNRSKPYIDTVLNLSMALGGKN